MSEIIIIEGIDGSGKTTLARKLETALDMSICPRIPPYDSMPRIAKVYDSFVISHLWNQDIRIIEDRSVISTIVYGDAPENLLSVWIGNLLKWDKVLLMYLAVSDVNLVIDRGVEIEKEQLIQQRNLFNRYFEIIGDQGIRSIFLDASRMSEGYEEFVIQTWKRMI